jgi:hypothetical protein
MFERDRRFFCMENIFPLSKKLFVFVQSGNRRLYQEQVVPFGMKLENKVELREHFYHLESRISKYFRPFSDGDEAKVLQRISLAETTDAKASSDLLAFLRNIGWIKSLEVENRHLREIWTTAYSILNPLYLTYYWDTAKNNLSDYNLSQKRFSDLKGFFVECYESLCRISVIACALENIIQGNPLFIRDNKRNLKLEDYRAMDNGLKSGVLNQYCIDQIFAPTAENALRNGIGHHSAHHDIATDLIEYRRENRKGVAHFRIPYVEFSLKCVQLFHAFDLASIYLHWALLRAHGIKIPLADLFRKPVVGV